MSVPSWHRLSCMNLLVYLLVSNRSVSRHWLWMCRSNKTCKKNHQKDGGNNRNLTYSLTWSKLLSCLKKSACPLSCAVSDEGGKITLSNKWKILELTNERNGKIWKIIPLVKMSTWLLREGKVTVWLWPSRENIGHKEMHLFWWRATRLSRVHQRLEVVTK